MFHNWDPLTLRNELHRRKERGYGSPGRKTASHQANMGKKRPTAVELSPERPAPKRLRPLPRRLAAANSNPSPPTLTSTPPARASRSSITVQTAVEDAALGVAGGGSTRTRSIGARSAHDTQSVHSKRHNRRLTYDGDIEHGTEPENTREEGVASEATEKHKSLASPRRHGCAQRGSLARRDPSDLRSPRGPRSRDSRSRDSRSGDSRSPRAARRRRADSEITRNSDRPSSVRSQTTGQDNHASEEEPQTVSDEDAEGSSADDENEDSCYLCLMRLESTSQRQCGDCSITICSGCIPNAPMMLPGHAFDSSADSNIGDQDNFANEEQESGAPASDARRTPGRKDERNLRRTSVETESVHIDQPPDTTYYCKFCQELLRMRYECAICSINLCTDCLELHPNQHPLREFACPDRDLHADNRVQDLGDLHAVQEAGSFEDGQPGVIGFEDDPTPGSAPDGDGVDDEDWIDEEETGHKGHEPASTGRPQRKRHRSSLSALQPAQGRLSRQSPAPVNFFGFPGSRREAVKFLRNQHLMLEMMAQHLGIEPSMLGRGGAATQQITDRRNVPAHNTGHSAKNPKPRRGKALASRKRRRLEDEEGDSMDTGSSMDDGSDTDDSTSDASGNRRPGHERDLLSFSLSDPGDDVGRRATRRRTQGRPRRWLPEDQHRLAKLKRKGWTDERIGAKMDRSPGAISQQWRKQKIR